MHVGQPSRRLELTAARHADGGRRGIAVAVGPIAADWAAVDQAAPIPVVEQVGAAGGLPVTKMTWPSGGRPRVVLYRVEGGGHLAGGAAYLPERIIGPVATQLYANGLALQFVTEDL